ncbi:hypothetical protein L596_021923 [Steinernema carpocapsae]|uniref:Uncharacterized protein n=1 Tax=Steinernema carpocapsae TaxID=34508 RepID=A0A4U5MKA6_STECR|nr:hypothetical protein L596_021923 [Steinernema carpocapsae]
MRSTFLCLLLLSCIHASLNPEKQVVCGEFFGHDGRKMAYDGDLNYYLCGHDCGIDYIASLCQVKYPNVSHGEPTNSTHNVTIEIPYYHWKNESVPEKINVEVKNYTCQDFIPAEILTASIGSWSEHFCAGTRPAKTRKEWIHEAFSECGAEPANYTLGGQYGKEDKFLEMYFICDQPKTHVELDGLNKDDTYYQESQLQILDKIANLSLMLMQAQAQEHTKLSVRYKLELKMSNLLTQFVMQSRELHFVDFESQDEEKNKSYMSRKSFLRETWTNIRHVGHSRADASRIIIFALLSGTMDPSENALSSYDVESHDFVGLQYFPELKDQVRDLYVDYMKNHTVGLTREHLEFLNETGAHQKLLEMYREIFNPGLIDRKYLVLKKPKSWVLEICVGVAVIVALVAVAAGLGCWMVKRKSKVGVVSVGFNRFEDNDDEKLVKISA